MVGWKCSCFVIATEGEPAVFRRKGENFLGDRFLYFEGRRLHNL